VSIKLNILYKLIGYLVVISVLPLLVLTISVYNLAREAILDLTSHYSQQLIENHRDYLQLQMEQVQDLASRIASIEDIGVVALRADRDGPSNAYDELSTQAKIRESLNVYGNLKGVVSIDLFTVKGRRFYVGDTMKVPPVSESIRMALFQKGLASPKRLLWLGVEDNLNTASASHKVLTALQIIRHFSQEKQESEPVGMLLINYSTDYLFDYFHRVDLGQGASLIVTDAQGRMIYTPDRARIGQPQPAGLKRLIQTGRGSTTLHLDGQDNLVMAASLPSEPWHVLGIIPQATLLAPMRRLTQIAAALIALCALVITVASKHFRRNVIAPVQAISDRFRHHKPQEAGDLQHLEVPPSQDEISELVRWFNAFLDTQAIRVQYEKELEDSRYKFANIFQQAPMPLALVRLNGELIDVNDFWLQQFGFEKQEVMGRTSTELGLWIDPAERARMLEQVNQTGIINRLEVHFRTKQGKVLICLLSGHPVAMQSKDLYILTPVDITRQRLAEQEIREINAKLESRVLSRTTKLEQTNKELNHALESLNLARGELVRSEKLAALGSLVAGIAHEVNTPVGVIVTGASILSQASATINKSVAQGLIRKSEILEYLHTATESSRLILSNANRAAHLIQSFKQVAVDQTSEQRREFELNEFILGLITSLNPTLRIARAGIELHGTDKIEMDSYPGLLAQVLTNLTMNAVIHGFTKEQDGRISINIGLSDELVIIQFDDNGIGIPEEYLDKIFDPFFTTKRGQGGTGLGLNIVFNIITKQFGGTISVQSKTGQGTQFKIAIPRVTKLLQEPA